MNNESVLRFFDVYADDAYRLAYSYLGSKPDAEKQIAVCYIEEGGGLG